VKFVKIQEGTILNLFSGKSVKSFYIDSEVLKRGFQMGFDTPVVHALTDGNWNLKQYKSFLLKV